MLRYKYKLIGNECAKRRLRREDWGDDRALLATDEIDIVTANRLLANQLEATQLSAAQE